MVSNKIRRLSSSAMTDYEADVEKTQIMDNDNDDEDDAKHVKFKNRRYTLLKVLNLFLLSFLTMLVDVIMLNLIFFFVFWR